MSGSLRRGPQAACFLALALSLASARPAWTQQPEGVPSDTSATAVVDTIETVDRIVAVVGDTAILYSEIIEAIVQAGAQGEVVPDFGTPAFDSLAHETLTNLVDSRILLQKAEEADLRVPQEQLDGETDRRFTEIRNSFPSATEFQAAVTKSGRTLVQYRQWLRGQVRSQILIDEFIRSIRDQLPPVAVTEEEIETYFAEHLADQPRPATIGFEQVVIEPTPGEAARDSALEVAQQALAELRDGKEFEIVAREYSSDLSNRDQGGDLGWVQRSLLVPAFADAAWSARTGQPVGPVETRFGFHIIRVDNVRGGERKIRHILIRPILSDEDFRRTGELAVAVADSIRNGEAEARAMAERYGVKEIPIRFPEVPYDRIAQFGEAYARSLANPVPGSVVGPFQTEGFPGGPPVFAIVRVTSYQSEGTYKLDDVREELRQNLLNEKGYVRYLDELRNEVYVDIRL